MKIKEIFKAIAFGVLIGLSVLLFRNQQLQIQKIRDKEDSLEHVIKTHKDSISRMLNDSLYKLSLIERSYGIDFNLMTKRFRIAHLDSIIKYCKEYNVPERMVFRLVSKESGFDSTALGTLDDKSYFQVRPCYWIMFKTDSIPEDLYGLMEVGVRGLSEMYIQRKNWREVLSIYKSGKPYCKSCEKTINWILK